MSARINNLLGVTNTYLFKQFIEKITNSDVKQQCIMKPLENPEKGKQLHYFLLRNKIIKHNERVIPDHYIAYGKNENSKEMTQQLRRIRKG